MSHVRFNWTVIGLVGGMLVQAGAVVVWGAKLDERVAGLEEKVAGVEGLSATMARVDERTLNLVNSVNRIEARQADVERRR